MKILINLLGIVVVIAIMYLLSTSKKDIPYKTVLKAIALQFFIAFILVKFPLGRLAVEKISEGVTNVLNYGMEGISFIFGSLADSGAPTGSIFGIQVLGNIIFISALISALYYLGVLGFVVRIIGTAVGKILGTSKVESFVAVANMFLGQTESPILVSKYLMSMTESEIMVVLISGMGSMSATIIGGYVGLGIPMEYILIASALVPFGSIAISKVLLPEVDQSKVIDNVSIDNKAGNQNLISAIAEGATNGLQSVLGIGASLIAIIGIVALINGFLGIFGITLQQIFSYIFSPLGFLMGLEGGDILTAGQLLGEKLVLNEFVAFQSLGQIINSLDYRTGLVMAISLCGFANISSMGICISGIAALCPEKRNVLAKLAFKAMIGGFAVSVLSSMIVGVIIGF